MASGVVVPRYLYPPERLQGYLLKDSPARWRRCSICIPQAQMRFVVVCGGRVFWSASDNVDSAGLPVEMLGVIDLVLNECEVADDGDSAFVLLPKHGEWAIGDFTGASRGRVFRFDATHSAVSKRRWMAVLQAHIKYAAISRTSPPLEHNFLLPAGIRAGGVATPEGPPPAKSEAPVKGYPAPTMSAPVQKAKKKGEAQERRKVTKCFAGPCQCLCTRSHAKKAKRI